MNARTRELILRAVRRNDARLERFERGLARRALLAALPRVLPRRLDALAAHGFEGTIELRIRGAIGGEPDRYELAIAQERCEVRRGPSPESGATITVGASDLVRLAAGAVGWPRLLGSGRLEIAGDPFVALRFPTLFRLAVR